MAPAGAQPFGGAPLASSGRRRRYLLVADAYQSVQFVRWIPDKLSLSKLASDLDGPLEPYACEFLVTGNHVGMVVCDSAQNIRVFQYAPTDKQSYQLANIEAGRQANFDLRLNCTSSFHLGKNCVSLSRHRLLRDSAGRSQGEHGDDSQNAVEFASLVSTTDGAAGVMCPIPPATYKVSPFSPYTAFVLVSLLFLYFNVPEFLRFLLISSFFLLSALLPSLCLYII